MKIKRTSIFKRDFKKLVKKHYDVTRFEKVAQGLFDYDIEALSRKYRGHALKCEWYGYREITDNSHLWYEYIAFLKYQNTSKLTIWRLLSIFFTFQKYCSLHMRCWCLVNFQKTSS